MGDAWFTEVADELARCLVDARDCAEAGERLLASQELGSHRKAVFDALVAPIAVSQALIDLIDYPPQVALAAARLLAETAGDGATTLATLDGLDTTEAVAALGRAAESSRRLLEAAA
ncbi:MAG: hypothetical protein QOI27_623 [Gaiellaceae bacterium]|jgi:hypothetical protein|nr:hypothetical protein [Gaiellaceae bacterium]MDX6470384.1 hypothetical protein [Gaiellaceae bacterium]MDX6472769.1 hypothetical protein [Gaiellaceae bacterium]